MINPQKAIKWYKDKYPVLTLNKSNMDIYNEIKNKYPEYEYPTENPFEIKEELNVPEQEELEEKSSPGFVEKILTSSLSDKYAQDSDWWAEAYNKSMAGTIHQIKYGKPKYEVDDVDRAWYDEAGQFFVGLAAPIDILTFVGSGGIGAAAAKTMATGPMKKWAVSGLTKLVGDSTLKKTASTQFGRYLASSAAIESGMSLATYGAAGAALQDQAQQSQEIKDGQRSERDYLQTSWAATKHGASSLALGSAAGYFTKGLMAPKYAKAKMSTDATFSNKVAKLTMNPAGQVIAEGSVFGTGQIAERALMGEEVNMDDFLESIFMNTAIVGGLRASTKPLRLFEGDVARYKKARKDFYGGIYNAKTGKYEGGIYSNVNNKKVKSKTAIELESLKNIDESFKELGEVPPKEVLDRIASLEIEGESSSAAYGLFEKNLKTYNKLLSEFNNKDIRDLPKDTKVKLMKEAGLINNVLYDFFTKMQSDRELGYQAYKKDYAGFDKLNDIQRKSIDKMVDGKVEQLKNVNEMLNAGALNEPQAINLMKKVYGDGFTALTREKNGKYEPILRTPQGDKVNLSSNFKGLKTKKQSQELGLALNDVYKKIVTGEDIGINKALGIKEKNVEYVSVDTKTGEIKQNIKKRGSELEVNKLVEEGKAVKTKNTNIESGIDIVNEVSIKNINNQIDMFAADITKPFIDKVKIQKAVEKKAKIVELEKIKASDAFKTPQKFVNAINQKVRTVSKQYKDINKLKFIETVASEAGIKNPQKFKLNIPKDKNMANLESFFITLDRFSAGNFFKKKDALIRFKTIGDIEKQANTISHIEKTAFMEKGLTQAYQKSLLKNIVGVEGGDILKANTKQLKEFNDFLFSYDNIKKDGLEWNILHDAAKYQSVEGVKTLKDMPKKSLAFIKSQHEAMKQVGAPELSTLLKDQFSIFENNYGDSFNKFMYQVGRVEGNNKGKNKSVSNGDYNIVSGKGEKYLKEIEYIDNLGLSAKERGVIKRRKKFFEKAINKEWFKTVDKGSGDALAKKNADGSYKYINLKNKEGRVIEQYIINIQEKLGKKKFEESVRRKHNQAQSEYIIRENDVKWVSKDEIYMPDILTKDGKNFVVEKNIKGLAKKIAIENAKEKYKKNFTKDKIYEETIWEPALAEARESYEAYFMGGNVIGLSKHFKPKTFLHEPFVFNKKGKLVRSYEYKLDKTTMPQARSMARDYATLETAPSYLNLKGIDKKEFRVDVGNKLKKRGLSKSDIDWVLEIADKQLGYGRKEGFFDILVKPAENYARFVAQTMLSSPTAGVKAFGSGTADALYVYKVRDMASTFMKVIRKDAEATNKALKANVVDIGLRDYTKKGYSTLVGKNLFKLGFMAPADKFMRTWVILASKHHQERQLKKVQNYPKDSAKYQEGYNTLKDFYFLTDKQISDLSKYGSSEKVLSDNTLSSFEKSKKMRDIEIIEDKLNTYAHINTQGSSADLFMPKIATYKATKPFLLFQRFAYASSENAIRMNKLAVKNKNIYKPLIGTTAKFVTGATMFSLYWNLLGRPMPKENSDWWERFKTTMWRGEFAGILGNFMNPYDDGMNRGPFGRFMQSMTPTIVEHFDSVMLHVGQLKDGKSTFKQAGDGMLRTTFSIYNNYRSVIDKRMNPLNRDKIRLKKLYSDFEEEVLKKPNIQAERSERTPYYIDLENTLYLGTEEEYAKQLAATYVAIIHDEYRKYGSMSMATKKANKILKTKFTTMNPNKASLFKSSKEGKINSMKFIAWLQKHPEGKDLTKRLFEIELEYKKRIKEYNAKAPDYWNKMNIKDLVADFSW